MSGDQPARERVPQPHGGVLTPFPAGVSGNPNRGPDLHPRKNIVESLIMRAMIREGTLLVVHDVPAGVRAMSPDAASSAPSHLFHTQSLRPFDGQLPTR